MKKAVLTLFAAGFFAGAIAQNTDDEKSINAIFATLESAWNRKSGQAFSAAFADVHDYIVVNGMYFPKLSRQGNAAAHQSLFDGIYKDRDINLKVDRIQFIRPDLAMATAVGASYQTGTAAPADPGIIMTVLLEKQASVWKIISFHNHEIDAAALKQRSPMPLNVMYAAWYKK